MERGRKSQGDTTEVKKFIAKLRGTRRSARLSRNSASTRSTASVLEEGICRDAGRPDNATQGTRAGERTAPQSRVRSHARQDDPPGSVNKLLCSDRRRCIEVLRRHVPQRREDEDVVTTVIINLANQFGRHGRRENITGLLHNASWCANYKRVERIWRQEEPKVPQKKPKRRRLWLNDGSCVWLRSQRPKHICKYDFLMDRTQDGRAFCMLAVSDEHARECLAVVVDRKLRSTNVIGTLAELFIRRETPEHNRSDYGCDFCAKVVRDWPDRLGLELLFIGAASPWENGYCESLNCRFRDELLSGEILCTLKEAKTLIENWSREYAGLRPHDSLCRRLER